MRRRTVLAGFGVALAGCQGTEDGTPTPAEPPAIDCAAASRPSAEVSATGSVAPRPYPGPPEDGRIPEWATAHEEAYLVNELLRRYPLERWYGLNVWERKQEPYRDGTVVRFTYTHGFAYDNVEADSPVLSVAYYVDERGARRAPGSSLELTKELDPTTAGETVVCF